MRLILATLGLALIASCTTPPPPTPAPTFRDASGQIASQVDVTADRMAGVWHMRQSFAGAPANAATVTFATLPQGALQMSMTIGTCSRQGDCRVGEQLILLAPTGPGRWTPIDPPGFWPDDEMWVMWMDFDSRTAAIGTPSGAFGWIMDKNPTGGSDRIIAARDIMEWFGYDTSQLSEGSR